MNPEYGWKEKEDEEATLHAFPEHSDLEAQSLVTPAKYEHTTGNVKPVGQPELLAGCCHFHNKRSRDQFSAYPRLWMSLALFREY
jgi:hypothetical protein